MQSENLPCSYNQRPEILIALPAFTRLHQASQPSSLFLTLFDARRSPGGTTGTTPAETSPCRGDQTAGPSQGNKIIHSFTFFSKTFHISGFSFQLIITPDSRDLWDTIKKKKELNFSRQKFSIERKSFLLSVAAKTLVIHWSIIKPSLTPLNLPMFSLTNTIKTGDMTRYISD